MTGLYRTLATVSPPRDRADLLVVLQAGIRAGAVPRELGAWLTATLELPDLRLRNAMVPRVDVVAVPDETSIGDAALLMADHGRRRLPVFRGTIDQPIGVLHALDVAHALAAQPAGQPPPRAGQGAAAGLHEIERLLDVRFPTNSVVSIGGLVYDRLGRVPQPGDVVELPGMRIEVLSVDGVRLRELRIRAGVGLSTSASEERRLGLRIGGEVVWYRGRRLCRTCRRRTCHWSRESCRASSRSWAGRAATGGSGLARAWVIPARTIHPSYREA
jgi:CBS domain containing-hemolysin-like protein